MNVSSIALIIASTNVLQKQDTDPPDIQASGGEGRGGVILERECRFVWIATLFQGSRNAYSMKIQALLDPQKESAYSIPLNRHRKASTPRDYLLTFVTQLPRQHQFIPALSPQLHHSNFPALLHASVSTASATIVPIRIERTNHSTPLLVKILFFFLTTEPHLKTETSRINFQSLAKKPSM